MCLIGMDDKYIEVLSDHVARLSAADFDLKSWKMHAMVLLKRMFGEMDTRIGKIEALDIDYSSWSLRDTSGESQIARCKRLGKEILESAIEEIRVFGISATTLDGENVWMIVLKEALNDALKGSQVKQLAAVLTSDDPVDEKKHQIEVLLNEFGENVSSEVLAALLSSKRIQMAL